MPELDSICKNCGLTFGAHRADSTVHDQCPMHEGWMDWPDRGITVFVDSGETGEIPNGTESLKIKSQAN